MLQNLIESILNGVSVGGRMLRELFTRFIDGIRFGIRSIFSAVNIAGSFIPKLFKSILESFKKPTSREDYIETKGMFISKKLILIVVLVIVALVVVGITVVRPFIVSKFGVAHMWETDPKTESYDGKVILYYDEEKKMPKFEGRLEKGIKNGEGKEYDEKGNVLFSGTYAEGQRNGTGKVYQEGKLVYEGTVAGEHYEGEGTLYYPDGNVQYRGGFHKSLYDGKGTLYDDADTGDILYNGGFKEGKYEGQGVLKGKSGNEEYRGEFANGVYEGEGELFRDGISVYKGGFSQGLYSGTGRLCDKTGNEQYTGGFKEGLFSGEGVYTAPNGIKISGTFEKGGISGDAVCSYGGDVFYKGNMNGLIPQGTGTLFSKSGSELYTGEILLWNVNGSSLLGLPAGDARKAFPQGVREDMGTEGFALTQDKLGLSLYSGYATAEEKAAIKRVYLMPTAQDSTMAMIHWKTPAEYEEGLRALGRNASCTRGAGICTLPDVYYSIEYISRNPMVSWRAYEQEDGSVLIMWLRSTGTSEDSILLCEWRKAEDAVEFTGKEVNPNGNVPLSEAFEQNPDGTGEPVKPGKDNALLSGFLMEDMTLAPTSDSNVKDELLKMQNEEDKRALLTDLIDYSLNSAGRVAAATNSEIYRGLAEETTGQIAIGKAEKDAVSKLEEKQREYDAVLVEKELSLIELEKKILTETGKTAEELDTQTVFLVVNPEDLNPEELGKVILSQTRKASGVPFVSSGPGATETEEDPALEPIMQDLSFEMRILNALYKNIGISRAELTEAKQQAEEAGEAMITGSGTQEAFALATAQLNDKQAALIADCAEFTKEMIILDRMTGGYISEKYQWFKETMPEIPVAENQFGVEGGG